MASYFSVITSDLVDFDPSHKTSASFEPGMIAKMHTDGTWKICTSASTDVAAGFMLPGGHFRQFPTNKNVLTDEWATVARGQGRAYIEYASITGGPTNSGTKLYCDANGELTTTDAGGQTAVGRFERKRTVAYGAGNTTAELAEVTFDFPNI